MLAGDSHANWVSDLVWLEEHNYDPATGDGAIGVELAGTAVSSTGFGGTIKPADNQSSLLIADNSDLQCYYGMPTVASRTPLEIPIANFSVVMGANKLTRPVAGGVVETGFLEGGDIEMTNLARNTETGVWEVRIDFNQMFIQYPKSS